ncbi:hypothetical protein BGW80DRAFT_1305284 [Lactifluus volemus]|nr:hypothetical protein BGW80DRAFT_1305284 [Lactifluus volemus]
MASLFTLDRYVLATLCSHLLTLFPAKPRMLVTSSRSSSPLCAAYCRLPFRVWSLLLVSLFPSAGQRRLRAITGVGRWRNLGYPCLVC